MNLILTNSSAQILISPEDAELSKYVWNLGTHGYPQAWFPELKEQRPLHQVVMLRQGIVSNQQSVIEHLNGNPLDNRRDNLRRTSQTENLLRAKGGGVRWHKQMKKWQVRLTFQYVSIHIGYYSDEDFAHKIALLAREQLLQMIATYENLTPSIVKSYFSQRKSK